jgi:hypothetical protein
MKELVIIFRHPQANLDHIGIIPDMLDWDNPKSAREQLDEGYRHGGGWWPMSKFKMDENDRLKYPGDPWLEPLVEIPLRDERIVIYQHAMVAIIQPDRSFEVSRMD